jgi:ketosteroid isomerase-like protein
MVPIAILAVAASAAHCPRATEQDVRARFELWNRAYAARDLRGTMAIFARDVRFQFQGAPDADWAALEKSYRQEFASPSRIRWVPEWEQVVLSGGVAASFSRWRAIAKGKDGKDEVRADNRGVDILTRGPDCHWRIVRSLNYPVGSAPKPSGSSGE